MVPLEYAYQNEGMSGNMCTLHVVKMIAVLKYLYTAPSQTEKSEWLGIL